MEVLYFIFGIGFGYCLCSVLYLFDMENEKKKHKEELERAYKEGYAAGQAPKMIEDIREILQKGENDDRDN